MISSASRPAQPPGPDVLARFICSQLLAGTDPGASGQRLVVLGLQPPARRWRMAAAAPASGSVQLDALGLAVQLLRSGVVLVLLDRPRNRELLALVLQQAGDGGHRVVGSCQLQSQLSSACQGAQGLLLCPGWRHQPALPWAVLAERLQSGAQVFDLRAEGCLRRPASCGLAIWQLGRPDLLTGLEELLPSPAQGSSNSSRSQD